MDRIGVGEEHQAVTLCQLFEHAFGHQGFSKNGAPDLAEAVVLQIQIEDAGELPHEIGWFHQARFEAFHQIGGGDAPRHFCGRVGAQTFERPVSALEIEIDQDPAQIENDGLVHDL